MLVKLHRAGRLPGSLKPDSTVEILLPLPGIVSTMRTKHVGLAQAYADRSLFKNLALRKLLGANSHYDFAAVRVRTADISAVQFAKAIETFLEAERLRLPADERKAWEQGQRTVRWSRFLTEDAPTFSAPFMSPRPHALLADRGAVVEVEHRGARMYFSAIWDGEDAGIQRIPVDDAEQLRSWLGGKGAVEGQTSRFLTLKEATGGEPSNHRHGDGHVRVFFGGLHAHALPRMPRMDARADDAIEGLTLPLVDMYDLPQVDRTMKELAALAGHAWKNSASMQMREREAATRKLQMWSELPISMVVPFFDCLKLAWTPKGEGTTECAVDASLSALALVAPAAKAFRAGAKGMAHLGTGTVRALRIAKGSGVGAGAKAAVQMIRQGAPGVAASWSRQGKSLLRGVLDMAASPFVEFPGLAKKPAAASRAAGALAREPLPALADGLESSLRANGLTYLPNADGTATVLLRPLENELGRTALMRADGSLSAKVDGGDMRVAMIDGEPSPVTRQGGNWVACDWEGKPWPTRTLIEFDPADPAVGLRATLRGGAPGASAVSKPYAKFDDTVLAKADAITAARFGREAASELLQRRLPPRRRRLADVADAAVCGSRRAQQSSRPLEGLRQRYRNLRREDTQADGPSGGDGRGHLAGIRLGGGARDQGGGISPSRHDSARGGQTRAAASAESLCGAGLQGRSAPQHGQHHLRSLSGLAQQGGEDGDQRWALCQDGISGAPEQIGFRGSVCEVGRPTRARDPGRIHDAAFSPHRGEADRRVHREAGRAHHAEAASGRAVVRTPASCRRVRERG
ncbi:MAG: hypothetical protein MO847_06110 [Candidatus Protistobacter heckmanni]|nr:hypothetical protein [Candidatus Protistobacter heckmanni]